MGIVGSRIETIRGLSRETTRGEIDFDASHDPDRLREKLTALPGIGDWTAQYVAMRGLKFPDAFPASDLGLLKAIDTTGGTTAKELRQRADAWRPWRAYAAMLLWGSLENSGG